MGRKHCGKRRKCWLPAFSPFPTMFSKAFFNMVIRNLGLCGKELIKYQNLRLVHNESNGRKQNRYGSNNGIKH